MAEGRGREGNRGVPDVSAAASPDSGWLVRDYGNWDTVGGTSAAAPFWAASMLLAHQYAAKQGAGKHCFLAPILYRLATTKQRYAAFHDVRVGGNRTTTRARAGTTRRARLARRLEPRPRSRAYLRNHSCP